MILPWDMPVSMAISWTFRRRSAVTGVLTAGQQSSPVASNSRPALGTSSSDVWPCLDSATHLVTVAYDGALSP